ncbi:MAG TPA: hypothetical protein EYQ00_04175, partial [Dehalococcoidia bacterium]|nr:hypothetical protein [Dehalococcoidia bacterium]
MLHLQGSLLTQDVVSSSPENKSIGGPDEVDTDLHDAYTRTVIRRCCNKIIGLLYSTSGGNEKLICSILHKLLHRPEITNRISKADNSSVIVGALQSFFATFETKGQRKASREKLFETVLLACTSPDAIAKLQCRNIARTLGVRKRRVTEAVRQRIEFDTSGEIPTKTRKKRSDAYNLRAVDEICQNIQYTAVDTCTRRTFQSKYRADPCHQRIWCGVSGPAELYRVFLTSKEFEMFRTDNPQAASLSFSVFKTGICRCIQHPRNRFCADEIV